MFQDCLPLGGSADDNVSCSSSLSISNKISGEGILEGPLPWIYESPSLTADRGAAVNFLYTALVVAEDHLKEL
jgi:hypothetical protein